jgi:hypothetical protein
LPKKEVTILLLANKLDYIEEMNKFSETYNLPRLSHEKKENLSKPVASRKI